MERKSRSRRSLRRRPRTDEAAVRIGPLLVALAALGFVLWMVVASAVWQAGGPALFGNLE